MASADEVSSLLAVTELAKVQTLLKFFKLRLDQDLRKQALRSLAGLDFILQELAGFLGAAPGSGIDSRLRKSIEPPRRVTLDYDARRP